MPTGFALDPEQGLGQTDELRLVTLGAEQKEALDSVRDALASLNGGRK